MKTTKMLIIPRLCLGCRAILVVALGLILSWPAVSEAAPMGTAFTYQGHLYDDGGPANGMYDFQFKLFDDPCTASQIGSDVNKSDVDVIDAYFVVELDFNDANAFNGDARWLEIGIRPGEMNDPCEYTVLSPRQEVTPTPYALYAANSGADSDWMVSGNDMYSIPSGNVGIGTSSPEKKLDITSESYTDLGIGLNIKLPGGTSWDIDNDGGIFKIVEHAACGPEFVNNTRIAVVGNCISPPYSGNVGIGTTEPLEKLHIDGNLCFTEKEVARTIYVEKSDGVDERGRDLEIYAGECNAEIIETLSGGDLKLHGGRGEGIAGGNVYIYGGHGSDTSPVGNVILAHNGTDAGGKVGIGTTSPQGTLDVNGPIYQRGGLLHADYVFEPGYELESIDEHSEYMWQNKHLSALPKAKVAENGQEIIEVGAHRRGIIEELEKAHIYIEQLHNQNKALERRVAALEKMILHQQFVSAKEVYNETH